MYRLTVLADDFTGALDTGAQFAKMGVETLITMQYRPSEDFEIPAQVLVINLESRHLEPDLARKAVREVVLKNDSEYYYKKTDSSMRGNIGAELEGMLQDNEAIAFVPAFPQAGRVTINGIHYADEIPVSRTVFGQDPFEPVTCDYIPDIIAKQTDIGVSVIARDMLWESQVAFKKGGILVFDAADDTQMKNVAETLKQSGPPRLLAGCAGFARYLPEMLNLQMKVMNAKKIPSKLVVLSGSINDITIEQVSFAGQSGFEVIELSPEEKLCEDLSVIPCRKNLFERIVEAQNRCGQVVVQVACSRASVEETDKLANTTGLTKEHTRQRIAENMGSLAKSITQGFGGAVTLAVFGGDTLAAVMRHIGAESIKPFAEIASGIVLSEVAAKDDNLYMITKSGGFGGKDIIVKMADYINGIL